MLRSVADRRAVRLTAETLLIGTAGGLAFESAGLPAGLISGSVLAVAVAALAGRPLRVPSPALRVILVLAGIALGSGITPETLSGLASYPTSVGLLLVSTACLTVVATAYLRVVHRWNLLSALFGASPGALAQVLALSLETGADVPAIVVVQTMRVVVLTIGLPSGLAAFGLAAQTSRGVLPTASLPGLAALVAVATLSAMALQRIRFPGGLIFGAMVGSGLLHGLGFVRGGMPWWIADAVMVALGTVNGSRFAGTDRRMILGYAGAALGSFAVAIVVSAVFMALAARTLSVPPADIVIAFAPGAQDTMMVLALAMRLDPVFVGAHHLARFLGISVVVPLIARTMVSRGPPP